MHISIEIHEKRTVNSQIIFTNPHHRLQNSLALLNMATYTIAWGQRLNNDTYLISKMSWSGNHKLDAYPNTAGMRARSQHPDADKGRTLARRASSYRIQ